MLLVQCFKDILSTVVSKESWTISLMPVSEYSEALRVILNFDIFLSKNNACRKAILRLSTVLEMAELNLAHRIHLAPCRNLTQHKKKL